MPRLTGLLLPVPLLVALALPAAAVAAPLVPEVCAASGPKVCFVDVSESAQVTVPAGAGDTTYAHLTATVTNRGTSTATHFTITDVPPAGVSVLRLAGADGAGRPATCSAATGLCSYGNLAAGRSATIDVVVLAVTAAAAPTGGTTANLNTLTLRVDEGANDNPSNGGKVDTTALSRSLTLVPRTGAGVYSYVLAGVATTLTTDRNGKPFAAASADAAGSEVGTTEIPANLGQSVAASVRRSPEGACPGTCAMPDWMEVSLPDFPAITPSGYLKTTIRADASLIATVKGLTAKTVVVWYQPDTATAPVSLPLCTLSRTGVPTNPGCFVPTKEKDGDLTVTVYERHNGRMRL